MLIRKLLNLFTGTDMLIFVHEYYVGNTKCTFRQAHKHFVHTAGDFEQYLMF